MKSIRAEMVEEISKLTTEELRKRLSAAEHLIYVLEARLKDASGTDPCGPLCGMDMYRLIEDEKVARAAYAAAREKKTTSAEVP